MKRFHVHADVEDLQASIVFYSKLFGAEPARVESDYAKWMLDDPRINFAISMRGARPGVDHLGIQTDSAAELAELKARAAAAELALNNEGQTACCYARSDKHWITDPQGIAWEHFHTLGDIPTFNEAPAPVASASACCYPADGPAAAAPSAAAVPVASAASATPVSRGKPVGIAVKSSTSCC